MFKIHFCGVAPKHVWDAPHYRCSLGVVGLLIPFATDVLPLENENPFLSLIRLNGDSDPPRLSRGGRVVALAIWMDTFCADAITSIPVSAKWIKPPK